jgi:hypothetical protein
LAEIFLFYDVFILCLNFFFFGDFFLPKYAVATETKGMAIRNIREREEKVVPSGSEIIRVDRKIIPPSSSPPKNHFSLLDFVIRKDDITVEI